MISIVPANGGGRAFFTQRTTLDGRDYQLTFQWNGRMGRWTFALADQDGDPIRSGMVLTTNWPLLRGLQDDRAPTGVLAVIDMQERAEDPGFKDLGDRHLLMYFDAAEVAAARAAA